MCKYMSLDDLALKREQSIFGPGLRAFTFRVRTEINDLLDVLLQLSFSERGTGAGGGSTG